MLSKMLSNLRTAQPLIHNITNYVTVNDCANILLACGASPIMADASAEVEEITSICNGLTINIGTLNQHIIPSMFLAGAKANVCNIPVLLDPVGAGASTLRTLTALELMKKVRLTAIRGNISEIKALFENTCSTKGVDANLEDTITMQSLPASIAFAKEFAKRADTIIAITGPIDVITDGTTAFAVRNGHPVMSKITGTGCMLSTLTTAFLSANPKHPLFAVLAAVCSMGLCGEIAYTKMIETNSGSASLRTYLIDAIYQLDGETLEKGAKYDCF